MCTPGRRMLASEESRLPKTVRVLSAATNRRLVEKQATATRNSILTTLIQNVNTSFYQFNNYVIRVRSRLVRA